MTIPKELETYRAMALSTAHLTEKCRDVLELQADSNPQVMSREYGFFIKLTNSHSDFSIGDGDIEIRNIIQFANKNNFQLIEFDRDADPVDLFPVFEWQACTQ